MVQNNEEVKQEILEIVVQKLPNTSLSLPLSLSHFKYTYLYTQYVYSNSIYMIVVSCDYLYVCISDFRSQSSHYVTMSQTFKMEISNNMYELISNEKYEGMSNSRY